MAHLFEKPAEGAPCNGCGWCCISEPCTLAVTFLGAAESCPALEQAGDRYACGLITNPGLYVPPVDVPVAQLSAAFGQLLGIGRGCDSRLGAPA